MPLVEIKMVVDRHTTAGARLKGEKVLLPKREAEGMIARGQAKAVEARTRKKADPEKETEAEA